MKKQLLGIGILLAAYLFALCAFGAAAASESTEPSRVPAAEFGEGMTFSANTGRYGLTKALSAMPLTWEATVYFPYGATSGYAHVLLSNYERSVSGYSWDITKAGHPSLMFYNSSEVTRYTFNTVNVYSGVKMHLAIVADTENRELRCYVDGVPVETLELTVDPAKYGTSYSNLGTDQRELNLRLFSGALMRIACYADVRSAEEILADMTAPGTDGLVLHYDMAKTAYGDTVTDLSVNKNHAVYEHFWYDEIDNVTDYAYSVAVVGDTQHNVQYQPENFAKLYDWLRTNAAGKKTAFVLGVGDITNDDTEEQWAHALSNFAKLDGVLPYALARGNHDGTADSYSARFAGTAYAKAVGECYYGNLTNTYRTFKAGNVNYLVLTLDYLPTEDVLTWAKGVAEAHPYHRVLVVTHFNLSARNTLSTVGSRIWNGFVKDCPNVEMVFSGHVINDKILRKTVTGTAGNRVTHFMINGQSVDGVRIYEGKEAAGLVAMFYFDASGRNLKVEYYSTTLDKYFMECNQFTATVGDPAGDVDFNGEVTLQDVLRILNAYLNQQVCYNGDLNGDAALGLLDAVLAIKAAVQ